MPRLLQLLVVHVYTVGIPVPADGAGKASHKAAKVAHSAVVKLVAISTTVLVPQPLKSLLRRRDEES